MSRHLLIPIIFCLLKFTLGEPYVIDIKNNTLTIQKDQDINFQKYFLLFGLPIAGAVVLWLILYLCNKYGGNNHEELSEY